MRRNNLFLIVFFFLNFTFLNYSSFGQNVQKLDFSKIIVNDLTDDQVRSFMRQIDASKLSEIQIEQAAKKNGMKDEEITKLLVRVKDLNSMSNKFKNKSNINEKDQLESVSVSSDSSTLAEKALLELKSKIFGSDLFDNKLISFEPNLRMAAPSNYRIGPDDVIQIQLFGISEVSYSLKVSSEGKIIIPNIGLVSISNLSISQAQERIKFKMSSIYSALLSGKTTLNLTLESMRSIKVIVTGDVNTPGTYTIPSVASIFNVLYSCGGPSEDGTYRDIKVIRNGIEIAHLDIYDFLLKGDLKQKIYLQDQDVILVKPYISRLELIGEVKKPGIFEILPGERLQDLIAFSGGFTEQAFLERIKIIRNNDSEREIIDVVKSDFNNFRLRSGDKIFVEKILDRFLNRVKVSGAVFRPGQYSLDSNLTVKRLISKAEGLREDAFTNVASINRIGKGSLSEVINFDLSKVLSGASQDIRLIREDELVISSILNLREQYKISIIGFVASGDITINFNDGMTVEDALIQSGGVVDAASLTNITVSRRIKNIDIQSSSYKIAQVYDFELNKDFINSPLSFKLKPFDIVIVRKNSKYEIQKNVKIEGEVLYPGTYTIVNKSETIFNLIERAGGLTSLAYLEGASLKRIKIDNKENISSQSEINNSDSTNFKKSISEVPNQFVSIELAKILKRPNGPDNLLIQEGDLLYVPKKLQTVSISGQIYSPVTTPYIKGKRLKYYISAAGGLTQSASSRSIYVKNPNGATVSAKKFLFFNFYPKIKPGADIIVPFNTNANPVKISELVSVTGSILTLYLLISNVIK